LAITDKLLVRDSGLRMRTEDTGLLGANLYKQFFR